VQLSSWTLILLTSERLISVWMPFKCKELCSRRRIIIVWIAIAILLFGANMHFFFTFDVYANQPSDSNETFVLNCDLHDHFIDFFIGPWYWIDALLGDFIPFFLVFVGNCAIVTKILASQKLRSVTSKDDKGNRKVTSLLCLLMNPVFRTTYRKPSKSENQFHLHYTSTQPFVLSGR